jgi:Endoplasmic Reticulum-Golgi Intermediate Compartment (ERGIC)
MSGNLRWMGRLDLYRKVPMDLLEGTKRGSILSLVASFVMLTLFLLETGAFFRKTYVCLSCVHSESFVWTQRLLAGLERRLVTNLRLDSNDDVRVRLNFNITMMDLKCDYAVVDVVSVLGTEQNVSHHITKWHVDAEGVRQRYQGRNKQQKDLDLFDRTVTRTLEQLYENGEDAISLSEETFGYAVQTQEYVFVDFYASWYVVRRFELDERNRR